MLEIRHRLLLIVLVLFTGCNIFSPLHSPGSSDDPDELISDAEDALIEGDYREAMRVMEKALRIAPNNDRVRYFHALVTTKFYRIDLLDIIDIFEADDTGDVVDTTAERVLFLSDAELSDLYSAYRVVSSDLSPLVSKLCRTGREISGLAETDDVLLSYGIAEILIAMLQVIDNDTTDCEFSPDERVVISKTDDGYDIELEDPGLSSAVKDSLVDEAIERGWDHFVAGRASFFAYYQFVVNNIIWTNGVGNPPAPLPEPVDTNTVAGSMASFVNDGVQELYEEKEDLN